MFSSPVSSNRSPRIPSPPPSLPTLFPAISSLSPLAPLMNSTANSGIFDLSMNNNNNNRTNPLPPPVFLDLQTEINRSVMAMPSLSSLSDFGGYGGNRLYEPLSNQKINTKTDLFAGSPLLQESLVDAPGVPSYYDKMSSFHSTMSSCGEILSSLAALFQQNNIDHKIKEHKKQIKGLAYVNEHPVHFRVYVYYQSLSKYLVEFQKRDGCCFAYRQLYKSLVGQMSHQLCQEQCVSDTPASYSGSLSLAPLSLKESRSETFNQCSSMMFGAMPLSFLDHDSVNILLTMAQGDCLQSQREALRALSSSSAHDGEQACNALADKAGPLTKLFAAMNTIVVNVNEQDQELIRCALTFFNNLLGQQTKEASSIRSTLFSGAQMDAQRLINKILSLLDDPIHLSDELTMAEIKRQCARLIATLSQYNGNDIQPLLDTTAWSIINRYENCDDNRLRNHINAAKVALAK